MKHWLNTWVNHLVQAATGESDLRSTRAKIVRSGILLLLIAALMLLPIHVHAGWAYSIAGICLLVLLLAIGGGSVVCQRVVRGVHNRREISLFAGRIRVPIGNIERPISSLEASARLIQRFGIAIPALIFFLGWALLYAVLWLHDPGSCPADPALHCSAAFAGTGPHPTFGDFLYLAVNEAFANPPPDLFPTSQLTRTATTLETLSGVLLVTLFASSFFGVYASEHADAQVASVATQTDESD